MIKNLGGGGGTAAAAVTISAGSATGNLGSIVFSNSNNVSFGLNGSTVTASASGGGGGVAIAASDATFTSGTVVMSAGGGALTISSGAQSAIFSVPATSALTGAGNVTVSTNGSTISVSGFGAGTGYTTGTTTGVVQAATFNTAGLSSNEPYLTRFIVPSAYNLTPISAPANAAPTFQYVSVPSPVTGSRIDLLMAHSGGSTNSNTTGGFIYSGYAAIYTINGASLSSLSSGSTQTTFTWNSNSAGQTQFTQSNIIPLSVPVNFNMPPGEYIVGVNFVTNSAGGSNMGNTWSVMGGNNLQTVLNAVGLGNGSAASSNLLNGMGVYSASSTGLAAAYSLSGIVMTGSSLSQANVALVFRNA